MKKIKLCFILLLTLVLTFVFVGCNSKDAEYNDVFATVEELTAMAKANKASSSVVVDDSQKGTPNFNVPAGGYDGSEVEIKFYHTMGQNLRDVLDLYIADFNEIYPNIHIKSEQVGGYDDVRKRISTDIMANEQPNIAYCYPDHVALYNRAGAVAHLDNLINSTESDGNGGQLGLTAEQKADFIEGYYNEGMQFGDGLMYTMPFSKSTEVLYYNKTFFDEHEISVPDHWFAESADDKTSLEYVLKKIKEIDPTCIPLGYDSEANWFITMCEQIGSGYTSSDESNHYVFNNANNKGFVAAFREWYQNGLITTQTLYGGYTSGLFINRDPDKANSYISIGSSAGATHQLPEKEDGAYPFEVGIASIPQMNPENPKVISQGPSVCIFNKGNPQEVVASWLFVKFLTTSVEFQAEFSMKSGYVPVLKSVAENKVYANFINKANGGDYIAALSAKVCLEQEAAYYTSPAFRGSSKARDEVGGLMTKAISGKTDDVIKFINKVFADAIYECRYSK